MRLDGAVVFDGAKIEAGAVVERSIVGFGRVSVPVLCFATGSSATAPTSARAASCSVVRGCARCGSAGLWNPLLQRHLTHPASGMADQCEQSRVGARGELRRSPTSADRVIRR